MRGPRGHQRTLSMSAPQARAPRLATNALLVVSEGVEKRARAPLFCRVRGDQADAHRNEGAPEQSAVARASGGRNG